MEYERKFDELCNKVKFCTRCPRMEESARVLSRAAGPLDAELMFIGEAPGRLGADMSEIPFHGDQAGHNFEELLEFAGLDRSKIFVTNAVLCNPKATTGNNATPHKSEMQNCSGYLHEQIELVQPKIIATLGSVALEALSQISAHKLKLSSDVRTINSWYRRKLIPLYHPGARAMVHRSMGNQRSDYQFVAEHLRKLAKPAQSISGQTKTDITMLAKEIIRKSGSISYFALHKLFFLLECEASLKLGRRLTSAFFLRQKDGPYCTDLHLARLKKSLPALIVSKSFGQIVLTLPDQDLLETSVPDGISEDVKNLLDNVLNLSGPLSDAELKTRVYLTRPMRNILRLERTHLVNLYNTPINFNVLQRQAKEFSI